MHYIIASGILYYKMPLSFWVEVIIGILCIIAICIGGYDDESD